MAARAPGTGHFQGASRRSLAMRRETVPEVIPSLSPGRHRNPKRGACFMEMASLLAGERWSDHPACTHPVLAAVARTVNDLVGDRHRQRLVVRIPDVIGLTSDDPRVSFLIARKCALVAAGATTAPRARRRVTATGLLHCERMLNALDGRPVDQLSPEADAALNAAPDAHRWARQLVRSQPLRRGVRTSERAARAIARSSVATIADHWPGDADKRLVQLLDETIDAARSWMAPEPRLDLLETP
jgi:hypothetical protein